ncbi:cob(I)yrinic acid a,c-diamide adenosyltransferase [Rubellimicrobium roseum]|uniref:corrinoid adenosyltransferase n=2 Tax=Rubellimicrobium roseum TaxID=687525 RepID=A0A5C4NL25_9RHOB|nr:cob(I)yrinic acid a,c-diamide adenosyltransferase [Rubellimicrobium roseum]
MLRGRHPAPDATFVRSVSSGPVDATPNRQALRPAAASASSSSASTRTGPWPPFDKPRPPPPPLPGMTEPRRLLPSDPALAQVLPLVRRAFAEIAGRIDPPSSLHRMTEADLLRLAEDGEVWALGEPLVACAILSPRPDALYLGRLSVDPAHRRRGHARALLRLALTRARARGLPRVTLGCRVELAENHALFLSEGFRETHRETHPGYGRPTSVWFEKRATPMDDTTPETDDARHAQKMAKKKAARDKIMASKTEERGLVIVHTGKGKGKSSAAFGMIFRCIAHGMHCAVVQFIKGAMHTGERDLIQAHFSDLCEFHAMGEGFTWETQDRARDIAAATKAWDKAKELIRDPANRMVLLDEINIALRYDYIPLDEVLTFLRDEKPPTTHVVLTGRNAADRLIEQADLVTEMELVKHPFRSGVKAQAGVEF